MKISTVEVIRLSNFT